MSYAAMRPCEADCTICFNCQSHMIRSSYNTACPFSPPSLHPPTSRSPPLRCSLALELARDSATVQVDTPQGRWGDGDGDTGKPHPRKPRQQSSPALGACGLEDRSQGLPEILLPHLPPSSTKFEAAMQPESGTGCIRDGVQGRPGARACRSRGGRAARRWARAALGMVDRPLD